MVSRNRLWQMIVLGMCCLALGLFALSTAEVSAEPISLAIDFYSSHWGTTITEYTSGHNVGWSFVANTDLYVTDLAFCGNELIASHDVWISDESSRIIDATIPAGTAATLFDGRMNWRYISVEPTLLKAGTTYNIYAHYNSAGFGTSLYDRYYYWPEEYNHPGLFWYNHIDPRISVLTPYHSRIEIGPNLFIVSVPEPSTIALLTISALALLFFRVPGRKRGHPSRTKSKRRAKAL